jgi:cohesin loading factor subunit SCC2
MKSQVLTPTPKSSSIAVVVPSYNAENNLSSQPLILSPYPKFMPIVAEKKPKPLKSTAVTPVAQSEPHTPITQNRLQPTLPTSGSISKLSVVIPGPAPTFRPEDYEVLPDSPDTPQHLSRKRRKSERGSDDELSMSLDQREKADLTFRKLQDHLQNIFEAEDQIEPDTVVSNPLLTATSDGISLSSSTQTNVEGLLQTIISVGRFSQVPLEDLIRLQKLSENALKDAETIDVKVEESMGESEIEPWMNNVSTADLGLKAARTALRLMSGGREDKQLYSEDITHAALNAFKNVMESCVIPIVEMRNSGATANLFKLLSVQKKSITKLLTQCRRLLSLFAILVASIELSETVINTLEFTTSRLIFVENAPSEKDSVLGIAKFDSVRVVAMNVLDQIFLHKPLQRQGIFDEILTSLEKLPVTKQSARQFKLPDGGSIQLVSALIMRLIQTSSSKSDDAKEKRRDKALEALNGGDEAPSSDQLSTGAPTLRSEAQAEKQAATAIQELRNIISPLLDTAKSNASYVVAFIVNKATKSTVSVSRFPFLVFLMIPSIVLYPSCPFLVFGALLFCTTSSLFSYSYLLCRVPVRGL